MVWFGCFCFCGMSILVGYLMPKKNSCDTIHLNFGDEAWCAIFLCYFSVSGLMSRMISNGLGDRGSFPDRVIPTTQKMVIDVTLLNTQHYKVRVKSKVEQSTERNTAPLHLIVVAIEKGAFGLPLTIVANFTFTFFGRLSLSLLL